MIKKYALAIKVGAIALIAGLFSYYKNLSKRQKSELDGIDKDSKLSALEAQARAEAADQEALTSQRRRSTDHENDIRGGGSPFRND